MKFILIFLIAFTMSCEKRLEIIGEYIPRPYKPQSGEQFASFAFRWNMKTSNSINLEDTPVSVYCYQIPTSILSRPTSIDISSYPIFISRLYDSNQKVLSKTQNHATHKIEAKFPYSKEVHSVKIFLLNKKTKQEVFLKEAKVLSVEEVKKSNRFEYNSFCYVSL